MRINEASKATGLSADTIRYYEKAGLLPPIRRDQSGHRWFSQDNVDWMIVLYWLRKTGMPMKVMFRYAALVHAGDHTIPERKSILSEHGKLLAARRSDLDRCDDLLAYKLAAYAEAEKGQRDDDEQRDAVERQDRAEDRDRHLGHGRRTALERPSHRLDRRG